MLITFKEIIDVLKSRIADFGYLNSQMYYYIVLTNLSHKSRPARTVIRPIPTRKSIRSTAEKARSCCHTVVLPPHPPHPAPTPLLLFVIMSMNEELSTLPYKYHHRWHFPSQQPDREEYACTLLSAPTGSGFNPFHISSNRCRFTLFTRRTGKNSAQKYANLCLQCKRYLKVFLAQ